MFKVVYKYKATTKVGQNNLNVKVSHKWAYLILDTKDNKLSNIYHTQINKLHNIIDIDINNIDKSYITQLSQYKLVKISKFGTISGRRINNIVVEHTDSEIEESELVFRGLINNKKLNSEITEISKDIKDMPKCYMYLDSDYTLHFITSAMFIMLPKDINVTRFIFRDTKCTSMLLSSFIFNPETTNADIMFYSNKKLEKLNISNLDFCNITSSRDMFTSCFRLKDLVMNPAMSHIHEGHESIYYLTGSMFYSTTKLHELDLRFMDFTRIKLKDLFKSYSNFYDNCEKIYLYSTRFKYNTKIYLPKNLCEVKEICVNKELFDYLRNKKDGIMLSTTHTTRGTIRLSCYAEGTNDIIESIDISRKNSKQITYSRSVYYK